MRVGPNWIQPVAVVGLSSRVLNHDILSTRLSSENYICGPTRGQIPGQLSFLMSHGVCLESIPFRLNSLEYVLFLLMSLKFDLLSVCFQKPWG